MPLAYLALGFLAATLALSPRIDPVLVARDNAGRCIGVYTSYAEAAATSYMTLEPVFPKWRR